jgi:hypothetical protein
LRGLQGIATHNAPGFDYYERAHQQSPDSARRLLAFAFQRGYGNPTQRPTAYQWLQAFTAVLAQQGAAARPSPVVPPPAPGPAASRPVPRARPVVCPVCGKDNAADEVYCQHCAAQLCGDIWCPHSLRRHRLAIPLLLARFGRHLTPEKARACPVCGGVL